jgi:hypothetical protein
MRNPLSVAVPSKKFGDVVSHIAALTPVSTRRIGHGGTMRSKPVAGDGLRQPQDGAPATRAKLAAISSHLQTNVLQEPEDARLTGGTRSLTRRLLGLNVGINQRKVSVMVAGAITQAKVA